MRRLLYLGAEDPMEQPRNAPGSGCDEDAECNFHCRRSWVVALQFLPDLGCILTGKLPALPKDSRNAFPIHDVADGSGEIPGSDGAVAGAGEIPLFSPPRPDWFCEQSSDHEILINGLTLSRRHLSEYSTSRACY